MVQVEVNPYKKGIWPSAEPRVNNVCNCRNLLPLKPRPFFKPATYASVRFHSSTYLTRSPFIKYWIRNKSIL